MVAATVAFGMGIDVASVGGVVHAALPRSLEEYVQQVGRAGRDGAQAACFTLLDDGDYCTLRALGSAGRACEAQAAVLLSRLAGRWAEAASKVGGALGQTGRGRLFHAGVHDRHLAGWLPDSSCPPAVPRRELGPAQPATGAGVRAPSNALVPVWTARGACQSPSDHPFFALPPGCQERAAACYGMLEVKRVCREVDMAEEAVESALSHLDVRTCFGGDLTPRGRKGDKNPGRGRWALHL